MSNPLQQLLSRKQVVLADGAMGTSLFKLGLGKDDVGVAWNVAEPGLVRSVHQGFVDAGSDILLTNTFGANRLRLRLHRMQERARELNIAGARIARDVADRAGRTVVVAGDIGPTGDLLEPLGPRSEREAEDAFYEQAVALKEGGVDIAWIETMFAANELECAVRAVHRAGLDYVATMTFDTGGKTMMGVSPEEAIRHSRSWVRRPLAFGANCGVGPAQLIDSVFGLVQGADEGAIVVAKANCGVPIVDDSMVVSYNGTPEILATYACMARDAGARIIGGCCGTTPAHIAAMAAALASRSPGSPPSYQEVERALGAFKPTARMRETARP